MRERFIRFMAGRNGIDYLSRALLYLALALFALRLFLPRAAATVLGLLALLTLAAAYYRVFSRDLVRRRIENTWYCRKRAAVISSCRNWWERCRQRKDYKFFRCPSCGAMLRVPRGKGRLRVTCRKCGGSFEGKT